MDTALLDLVRSIFDHHIPFNKVLGLSVESVTTDEVAIGLPMRPELVGNFVHGTLHGRVISAKLDVTGGLVAFVGLLNRAGLSADQASGRFGKLSTIDLRVDYLRPGLGSRFTARGYLLRVGKRVAVTRTELYSDMAILVATGTAAY